MPENEAPSFSLMTTFWPCTSEKHRLFDVVYQLGIA